MIKKTNSIVKFVSFFLVIVLYLLSRFQNILSIPVFGDEAIYVRWSQIIESVETLRFIPLTDGKQPLYMWFLAGFFKVISSDPLFIGRLISVLSGLGIMIFVFLTVVILLNYKSKITDPIKFVQESILKNYLVGLFSCLIYILTPFSFFFDRMALPDNTLSFFGTLSLFLSLLTAKFKRLDLSIILGVSLGLAWLTKSPAIYFIVLSFLTFVLINLNSLKSVYLPAISAITSFLIYSILRLGPQFHMIAIRNKDYIWPLFEVIKHPLDPFKPHIIDTFMIYSAYISIPLILGGLIGLILYFKNNSKNSLPLIIIALWWILPLLANAGIAKVFTARYILFTLPPLIVLLSVGIFEIFLKTKLPGLIKYFVIFVVLFGLNINFMTRLSLNPFSTNLTSTESGYIKDWTSGWGIKESSEYLIEQSKTKNVIVGTEGFFGTLPDGLQIYTNNKNNLTVFGLGLEFTKIPEKLIDAKNFGDDVYILINQSRLRLNSDELKKITLIKSFSKPGNDNLLLYKL
jgi:4-amino-4-deoxy-L-arabinose transferase-like glycosyltransferase